MKSVKLQTAVLLMPRLLWMLLFSGALAAHAHTLPISYMVVVCDADYAHVELSLNPFELTFYSELDRNQDGRLDPTELQQLGPEAAARISGCLKLQVSDKIIPAETVGLVPEFDSEHLRWVAHYRVDARTASLSIESTLSTITSASHLTQVTVLRKGGRELAQLDAQSPRATFAPLVQPRNGAPPAGGRSRVLIFVGCLVLLALPAMAIFGSVIWLILRPLHKVPPAAPPPARGSFAHQIL
jgi:hypothetical protein